MARKRIVGKNPSAIKKVIAGKKTTKADALGVSQHPIGKEAFFSPVAGGGLRRIGGEPIRKSLPKQQRLTLHDIRLAAVAIPMAVGSAYVGYKSGAKIFRALKKRPLIHNLQDLKEDAKKNLLHSLDIQDEFYEKKKKPFILGKHRSGIVRKKSYPRGGNPYYKSKAEEED